MNRAIDKKGRYRGVLLPSTSYQPTSSTTAAMLHRDGHTRLKCSLISTRQTASKFSRVQ